MKIEIKNPVEKLKNKKPPEKSEAKAFAEKREPKAFAEKREINNPADSESATKKIWFVESALAIAASFLAIIIASIY